MKKIVKSIKSSKAYGAMEYAAIISLVLLISIIVLNSIKSKGGNISSDEGFLSKSMNLASATFSSDPLLPHVPTSVIINFSQPFNYDFEDDLEVAVENYFTDHATVQKAGEVASYSLSGITRIGNYIQVDIEIDGETVKKQFAVNEICHLATDDDFDGTTNGEFRYTGSAKCVEIPHTIKGVSVTSYEKMFRDTEVKKVISTNLNILDMQAMFDSLESNFLDVSMLNTSGVTNMSEMFEDCEAEEIIGLENFDTSNVTDMRDMFENNHAKSLDLSSFNTSKVTNMDWMFNDSKAISINLSSFDTSKVDNMSGMFADSRATSLDLSSFDTSNVTNMRYMFYGSQVTSLDLSSFNTSKVTDMSSMFRNSKVTSLDLSSFDTSKVTDMEVMFENSKVTSLDLSSFDTSNVTSMIGMFENSKVTSLDLSSFDFTKANVNMIFRNAQTTSVLVKDEASQTKLNGSSHKPGHTIITIK